MRCSTATTCCIACGAPASAAHYLPACPVRLPVCQAPRNCESPMNARTDRKITLIGGGGVRTPLLVFGINEAAATLGCREFVLYDPDERRRKLMTELGRAIVESEGGRLEVREEASLETAIEGADFVLNSVRVGGIAARAADEIGAIKHGYPGQETTGPAGAAMALRTVGVALAQAKLVERLSPAAWIVNFTNP